MKIPKSWRQVPINKLLNIHAALEMRDIDKLDRNVYLCAAIIGKPTEWVESNLSLIQIRDIITQCTFAASMPNDMVRKYFWCGGRLWKVELEAKNITPGQFMDITTYTQTNEQTLENTARIMATICRPVFGKYDSKNVDKIAKLFGEKLRFDVAHSTALFFCSLYTKFLKATADYLTEAKMKKATSQALNTAG